MAAFQGRPLIERDVLYAVNGTPTYLGTISGAAATDNNGTATSFAISSGAVLLLQPDSACYIQPTVAAASQQTAQSVLLQANEKFVLILPNQIANPGAPNIQQGVNVLSMTPVSGTTNLRVFLIG